MNYHSLFITTEAAIAAGCWLIVALGAGLAVFSTKINDTLFERIGLSLVSLACVGTAWRVAKTGSVTETAFWLAMTFAFYVVSLFVKHWPPFPRKR